MEESKKILIKIKKLLALGESNADIHESVSAIKKAHELMKEHNVSMSAEIIKEIETDEDCIVGSFAGKSYAYSGRLPSECQGIAIIIKKLFDCEVRVSTVFENNVPRIILEVFGYQIDVEAAKWTYRYLLNELNNQYRKYLKDYCFGESSSRTLKKSFSIGFCDELKIKVDQIKYKEPIPEDCCTDLVLCKERAISEKYGEFKYKETVQKQFNTEGYAFGSMAGKKTNLNIPIGK